jgi:osmotically inducible protein OsmC
MKRTANAHWNGTIKDGKGNITTQSTVLNQTQYAFNTRFGDGIGTNPEELLAAAHAGCFTMAVSAFLSQEGYTPGSLDTKAVVEFDTAALKITGITLDLTASVIDGLPEEKFLAFAQGAKENCPISQVLKGTSITLHVIYK